MFLFPFKSKNPPESTPYVSLGLIAVNTIVFAFTSNGFSIRESIAISYGLSGENHGIANWIASSFLHGSLMHLLGNMWFLYLFGFAVEGRLRSAKTLLLYLAAGFAGDLLHYTVIAQTRPEVPMIGASGAIMGLLGASLYMFPFARMRFVFSMFLFYWRVFDWPMWGVALYYLGFDLINGLTNTGGGVANYAHLGGALGGFLVALAMRPKRDSQDASEAKAVVSEAKDYSVLSSRELAAIAASTPDDPFIALHWMFRSLRDQYGVKPECVDSFRRLLPRMLREISDPTSIGSCMMGLSNRPDVLPVNLIADCANRVERHGQFMLALQLHDQVIKHPSARPDDVEASMLRSAILCETALNNPQRALGLYYEISNRYGLSPIADQARTRAKAMESRGISLQTNMFHD